MTTVKIVDIITPHFPSFFICMYISCCILAPLLKTRDELFSVLELNGEIITAFRMYVSSIIMYVSSNFCPADVSESPPTEV